MEGDRTLNHTLTVRIKRVREGTPLPYYASAGAAGLDLVAAIDEPLTLAPRARHAVPTGIALALPGRDWVALVFARSGLATRAGLALANGVGVIDSDYRGEVLVAVVNLSDEPITIRPHDRIAQMLFVPVGVARLLEVDELDATERGAGGFGSTGLRAE